MQGAKGTSQAWLGVGCVPIGCCVSQRIARGRPLIVFMIVSKYSSVDLVSLFICSREFVTPFISPVSLVTPVNYISLLNNTCAICFFLLDLLILHVLIFYV